MEEDGNRFRIWCWMSPQRAAPKDPADDKIDPIVQFRNRNIRYKANLSDPAKAIIAPMYPSDPSPLGCLHSNGVTVTAAPTGPSFLALTFSPSLSASPHKSRSSRDGRIAWNSTANPLPSTLEELYCELAEQPRMEDPRWLGRP